MSKLVNNADRNLRTSSRSLEQWHNQRTCLHYNVCKDRQHNMWMSCLMSLILIFSFHINMDLAAPGGPQPGLIQSNIKAGVKDRKELMTVGCCRTHGATGQKVKWSSSPANEHSQPVNTSTLPQWPAGVQRIRSQVLVMDQIFFHMSSYITIKTIYTSHYIITDL